MLLFSRALCLFADVECGLLRELDQPVGRIKSALRDFIAVSDLLGDVHTHDDLLVPKMARMGEVLQSAIAIADFFRVNER